MNKFNKYLEAAKKTIAGSLFQRCKDDDSFEVDDIVYYEGKKRKVKSDEGDKLILSGVNGYVWKTDCEKEKER